MYQRCGIALVIDQHQPVVGDNMSGGEMSDSMKQALLSNQVVRINEIIAALGTAISAIARVKAL